MLKPETITLTREDAEFVREQVAMKDKPATAQDWARTYQLLSHGSEAPTDDPEAITNPCHCNVDPSPFLEAGTHQRGDIDVCRYAEAPRV